MTIPGYFAESSLRATSGRYRTLSGAGHASMPPRAMPQLRLDSFPGRRGGGVFGTIEDYYTCKQQCEAARSACLETCEGTWESPKPSRNCLLCDDDYAACMRGCSRDIA
jgi:hypothetical protein